MNEKYNLLKQLNIEDIIWIVYIGLIILCLYSNTLERNYILNNNINSKEKYRKINIFVFSIAVIVYLYFFKEGYKTISNLKPTDNQKKRNLNELSFLASTLILISGIIFLYIAIVDKNLDVELAFN